MNTNWTIHQLERKSDNGFVVNVHWRYAFVETSEDGEIQYYADRYGVISYTQAEDSELIPYEDLTKEIVIEWVKESLDMEEIEESLKNDIDTQKNPPILQGLPWD